MNKHLSNRIFVFALCICLLLSCFTISFALELELPKILTNSSFTLVKNCPIGNQVFFSSDDFEEKFEEVNLDLKGIVITSLPSPEVGTLLLGSEEVKIFDALPLSKLNRLTFRSNEGITSQTVEFSYKGYDNKDFFDNSSTVTVKITDEIVNPPTVEDINVFTMKNLSFTGFLRGDSNKDLTYTIVSQPKLGEISLSPTGNSFQYAPNLGKSGKDTFTYYASDPDGNRSDPATVSIDIKNSKNNLIYADMESHWANYSAVLLADRQIITGEKIGDANFFYPDTPVSKSDFLVMLMSTCNLSQDLEEVSATSLADDAQIPSFMKKYVSYALETGILSGEVGSDGQRRFNGEGLVTRAQAFKMMDAALQIPAITTQTKVYKDSDSIPTWASQPIINLESCGIIHGYEDNTIRPHQTLSKAEAATLLCQTMLYQEAQKPVSRSVFSFVFDWFK